MIEYRVKWKREGLNAKRVKYTAPQVRGASRCPADERQAVGSAGQVEVNDAMVERFCRRYYEITGRSLDRAHTNLCLTAALGEKTP